LGVPGKPHTTCFSLPADSGSGFLTGVGFQFLISSSKI